MSDLLANKRTLSLLDDGHVQLNDARGLAKF